MEIKVPKEVRQYHESIFFGLSLRQFGCSLAAVGAAVGLYFGCVDMLGTEATGWVCILGAAPLALAGFFTYNGMPLEKYLGAVIRSKFSTPQKRPVSYPNVHYDLLIKEKEEEDGKNTLSPKRHLLRKSKNSKK